MATTQDIHDLKAQFDERTAGLRESFGVVEGDLNRLGKFTHDFSFPSLDEHQSDDNNVRQATEALVSKLHQFDQDTDAKAHQPFVHELRETAKLVHDLQTQIDQHIEQHTHAHTALKDGAHTMAGNVEQLIGEHEAGRQEYLGNVQHMHDTLEGISQKLFGTAQQLNEGLRQKQADLLSKASEEFHNLLDGHIQDHLPHGLEQAGQQIVAGIQGLHDHATTAVDTASHELQQLISELLEFAKSEVAEKLEGRFKSVMEDAVGALTGHITEAIATTTVGVSVTTAMSPILPEAIAVNKALDLIRPAIKALKALEDIF